MFNHQKVKIMLAVVPLQLAGQQAASDPTAGYVIGTIISVLILVYLVYSLVKPEDF
jgi:K+-transporting ATPase KdpF subunit